MQSVQAHTQQNAAKLRRTAPQPLAAAEIPDALLSLKTATAISGLSAATLYRKAKAGELKLIKIGARCTRIRSDDLRAFLVAQG